MYGALPRASLPGGHPTVREALDEEDLAERASEGLKADSPP